MSDNETKTVLRAEIKDMREFSYNEAYRYFINKGFKPADDIDEYDGVVEWFSYDEKEGEVIPVYDYEKIRWGIELIIAKSDDYNSYHNVSTDLKSLSAKINELNEKYGDDLEWKFKSYTWYNGADEPIEF